MTKFKLLLIPIISTLFTLNSWSNNAADSTHSFNSFKLFKLKNPWLNTLNLAGITFSQNEKIGIANGGYQLTDGDFHRIREATQKSDYSLFSESYQVIKSIHFYGKLDYHNSNEKGNLWTGVFEPYRGNPYIIGDSISGANYHRESFQLAGGTAIKFSDKISAGILGEYFVGIGAKQKDPRPKNTVTNFSVSPSFIFLLPKSKVGFDIGYKNRKEEISYKQIVTNDSDPTYFMFKGMGLYSYETADQEFRFQSENGICSGVQYETNLFNFKSLTEIRAAYSIETTEDGSSTIKKEDAGDWKSYKLELNQQLIKQKNDIIQTIAFNGYFFNGDGVEYTQDKILNDDKTSEYITLAKNLKLNRKTFMGSMNVDFLKLTKREKVNWDASASAQVYMNNEKYYYIPEIFNADYTNFEAVASFQKNVYIGKIHVAPEIKLGYQFNLMQNIELSNDATITKRQQKSLYLHDFEFLTAEILKMSGNINLGYTTQNFNSIDQIYLSLMVDYWSPIELETKTTFISAKIGFQF